MALEPWFCLYFRCLLVFVVHSLCMYRLVIEKGSREETG